MILVVDFVAYLMPRHIWLSVLAVSISQRAEKQEERFSSVLISNMDIGTAMPVSINRKKKICYNANFASTS